MSEQHSKWPLRFLRWFCPPELLEEIEGDLIQRLERDLHPPDSFGRSDGYWRRRAKRRLMWNALRFFRPGILLRNKLATNIFPLMLSNYLKTAYRHAGKNKLSLGFRMGGLTLALFSFLVIAIYVSYQTSFDKFHTNYKSIFRVNSIRVENGKEKRYASVPSALGAAVKSEFPEVRAYTIVSEWGQALMRYQDKLFRSGSFIEADSSIFDVFTFEFITGDKKSMARPDGMVVTESLARQLFGNDDPINKLISFPDRKDVVLEVRAVVKDLPPNSSMDVKAIIPFGSLRDTGDGELYSWNIGYGGSLFLQLNERSSVHDFEEKLKPLLARNLPKSFDEREKGFTVFLQPLSEIYMGRALQWEFDRKGNPVYLYLYVCLAAFLLLIAGINYLNLSIADFSFRNKEVGVRKVLGARKNQIAFQLLYETVIHCLLSLALSVGILYLMFSVVAQLFGIQVEFSYLFQPEVLQWVSIIIFLLIIASIAYPAYCLSVNSPVHDLKRRQVVIGNLSVNKVLLLAQFVISVFCISATWVVGNQLNFIQKKDIGFDRKNLLEVFMPDRYPLDKAPVLKEEINQIPGVLSTSYSYYHITGVPYYNAWYKVESGNEMKQVMLNEVFVDKDFINTMGITLLEGRNFENKNEFKSAFIVNESAVKEFGWNKAIGKRIAVGHDQEEGGLWSEGTVVGVVKDFNTRSLHKKIEPLVMRLQYDEWPGNHLNVKYQGQESELIASIKKVYEKVLPGFLMDFGRVSERYENQYQAESKAFLTLQMATWIILLIACMGIFSMSLFMSFKRQKEFGIRKVVGASIFQIATLHIGHFLKIALVANLVALPAAYFVLHEWLDQFVYKTEISLISFLTFGCTLALLVILSSGYSALKSARLNPVDVIKIE